MSVILISGATGGIGKHLSQYLTSQGHTVIPLSRRESESSVFAPCDLTTTVPQYLPQPGAELDNIDWIIHLASSYKIDADLQMLANLEQLTVSIPQLFSRTNFLYVSSWVVHFSKGLISADYIRMKRACEARIQQADFSGCFQSIRIIRPSVVLGEGLGWTQLLAKLSIIAPLIPKAYSRSFIQIEELCQIFQDMITQKYSARVITALGVRDTISNAAAKHASSDTSLLIWFTLRRLVLPVGSIAIALLPFWFPHVQVVLTALAILLLVWCYQHLLPDIIGKLSDYSSGFVSTVFYPDNEQDLLALVQRVNQNIALRGYDNAHLYFHQPHSAQRTTISTKQLQRILHLDEVRQILRVQAGTNYRTILDYLAKKGLGLANYPNYHYISVGASIMVPVHGSSLEYPFMADLVTAFRYYDRDADRVVETVKSDPEFPQLIFNRVKLNRIVILEVELQVCPRQYYQMIPSEQALNSLTFSKNAYIRFAEHYELRIHSLRAKSAYQRIYKNFSQKITKELIDLKADSIGNKWNILQSSPLLSYLSHKLSGAVINYEWFFTPEQFELFWREIYTGNPSPRLYKILIRYKSRNALNTPYHNTVSFDNSILNTRASLEKSAELFVKYRPLEHLGKFSIENYIRQR